MKKLILTIAFFFFTATLQAQEMDESAQISQHARQYLLKPSGEYSVSYQDFFWVNGDKKTDTVTNEVYYSCPNHPDPFYNGKNKEDFSPDNQTEFCREIVVRIYYPTKKNKKMGAFYKPSIKSFADAINSLPDDEYPSYEKEKLIGELSILKSYTTEDKKIVKNKKFPVLLFSPAFAGEVENYENFITHLVSHGYIVVGINSVFISGYIALQNGHIVDSVQKNLATLEDFTKMREILLKDAEFVYEKMFDHKESSIFSAFNLHKIGIFGHSVGGLFAAQTVLAHPSWFQAVATLDFGGDTDPNRPTKKVYPIPVLHQTSSINRYVCRKSPEKCFFVPDPMTFDLGNNGYLVVHEIDESKEFMTYTDHPNFSDLSTLQYHPALKVFVDYKNAQTTPDFPANSFLGTADGWELTHNINKYLLKFFNFYLKTENDNPFGDCSHPVTEHSKLMCGPAHGV
jgi:hypothetical protein